MSLRRLFAAGLILCGGTTLPHAQFHPFPGAADYKPILELGLQWQLANPYGIVMDDKSTAWHGGRVHDLAFSAGGGILSASSSGGVWLTFGDGNSISLSRDWENPDVLTLASDPTRRDHFYAGCGQDDIPTSVGGLYETDVRASIPLLAPWRQITLPPGAGSVHHIVVDASRRRLVIACEGGLFWSFIPIPGLAYNWHEAIGDYVRGQYHSVALNSTGVLASRSGYSGGGAAIYTGAWSPPPGFDLVLTKASIPGATADTTLMRRTTVAACASQPNFAYASAVDSNGAVYRILASADGGKTWSARGATPPLILGNGTSGGVVHQIAVAPGNPSWVTFGLLRGQLSKDGGVTWDTLGQGSAQAIPHLHDDVHVVYFDTQDPNRLWLATDGGILSTPDQGATFESFYNEKLGNLQFLSTFAIREWYGTLSKSPFASGLVGGGLQDNGNVYSILDGYSPWKTMQGGDGGLVSMLPTGSAIGFNNGNGDDPTHQSVWNADSSRFEGLATVPGGPNAGGLRFPVDQVLHPTWRNQAGQLMLATGGDNRFIYGLFANDDGSDLRWHPIISWPGPLGQGVCATASAYGDPIFVSTCGAQGTQMYLGTPSPVDVAPIFSGGPSGTLTPLPAPGSNATGGAITRMVDANGSLLYATFNFFGTVGGATPKGEGYVIRSRDAGNHWDTLPDLPKEIFYGMDADTRTLPAQIFAATDGEVYTSENGGNSWHPSDIGLPRLPHSADLRFASDLDGDYLYLSTFGWSMWKAKVPKRIPPVVVKIPRTVPGLPTDLELIPIVDYQQIQR